MSHRYGVLQNSISQFTVIVNPPDSDLCIVSTVQRTLYEVLYCTSTVQYSMQYEYWSSSPVRHTHPGSSTVDEMMLSSGSLQEGERLSV